MLPLHWRTNSVKNIRAVRRLVMILRSPSRHAEGTRIVCKCKLYSVTVLTSFTFLFHVPEKLKRLQDSTPHDKKRDKSKMGWSAMRAMTRVTARVGKSRDNTRRSSRDIAKSWYGFSLSVSYCYPDAVVMVLMLPVCLAENSLICSNYEFWK